MVLGADGRRYVLLPAPSGCEPCLPCGNILYAGPHGGAYGGSIHYIGAMVPAIHRIETFSCARTPRRGRIHHDDRAPGSSGKRSARVTSTVWVANCKYYAAATGVLH